MRRKYPPTYHILGIPFSSVEDAMAHFNCSKKAILAYLKADVDHPYRFYTKHVELNGVLYKSHQDACDDLDVTIRNLRWYLAGTASDAIKSKIERKHNEENDPRN